MALIKFSTYANDEISLEGFAIMPIESFNRYMSILRYAEKETFPLEWYYSSNNFIVFNSYSDFIKHFSVLMIPESTAWEMQQYLNMYKQDGDTFIYGQFPFLEEIFYDEM